MLRVRSHRDSPEPHCRMTRLRLAVSCLLGVLTLPAQESRLSRITTGTGAAGDELAVGFVLGPGPDQTISIQSFLTVPTSSQTSTAPRPSFSLFDRTHGIIATNDGTAGAPDALVTTLSTGGYLVRTADNAGPVRLEINELSPTGARLLNTSARLRLDPGIETEVSLTVSSGTRPRQLLIRAAGPALAAFGVAGTLPDPVLRVSDAATSTELATNDNWATPANARAAGADTLKGLFARAGAFAFPETGNDAALLVDLAPGTYRVQVGDKSGAGGTALVEIYDITPASATPPTAAQARPVAADNAPAATSIAAATAPNHSADTDLDFRINLQELTRVIELYNTRNGSTRTGYYKVQPGSEDGFASDSSILNTIAAITLTSYHSADSNRDGRIDLTELTRVIQLYNFRNGTVRTGAYHVWAAGEDGFAPSPLTTVTIVATKAASDESGSNPGEYTITRTGDIQTALTVSYGVGGTAVNGVDYNLLPGTLTLPAGVAAVKLPLTPIPDLTTDGLDTVTVTLTPGTADYVVGVQASATATIADSPATLYVANLRPEGAAVDSIASGTATLLLSASGTLAGINVSFSNLSSAQVSGHLRLSPSGDYVTAVPNGQVAGSPWYINPVGPYASADLLDALRTGKIFVGIDTAKYPGGELKGTFIQGVGSQTFTPPAAPPAVSLTNVSRADAARFLMQATFGPKKSEIDALTGQSIDTWLTTQLAMPFSSHRNATTNDRTTFGGSSSITNWNAVHPPNRQVAWFTQAITAADQLRQRVAFALSQILVVSDVGLGNDNQAEPLAAYYDILGNGAFGNFRTLLENVTLNPMMGLYLSSLRSSKADPVAGTTPDENYAREIMQLFTIGLNELQPDGTLKLDSSALPITTYTQTEITETAKIFTGWSYPSTNLTAFRTAGINYFSPMQLFPAYHDDTAKTIVRGVVIPAAQGGTTDLRILLDTLFNHPNTGPFIVKQLIQRLITSNPSPAYVYRVAKVFENNGSGVRGDLGAVVRAIYTDYEARSPTVAANLTYGKLKEPLLRLTGLLRTFNASAPNGRYAGFRVTVDGNPITSATPLPAGTSVISTNSTGTNITNVQTRLAEAALRSPTVFNFFSPSYVETGPLAAAGLVAPEFQITDATTSVDGPNFLRTFITATSGTTTNALQATLMLDLTYEQTLVPTPAALVDHLATVMAGGNMPQSTRDRIVTALGAVPTSTSTLDRARTAVLLVATSPAGATQK